MLQRMTGDKSAEGLARFDRAACSVHGPMIRAHPSKSQAPPKELLLTVLTCSAAAANEVLLLLNFADVSLAACQAYPEQNQQ